jgi:hypothetical protein
VEELFPKGQMPRLDRNFSEFLIADSSFSGSLGLPGNTHVGGDASSKMDASKESTLTLGVFLH